MISASVECPVSGVLELKPDVSVVMTSAGAVEVPQVLQGRERWCDLVSDEEKQADHQVEAVWPRGRHKRQRRKQPETVHSLRQEPAGDDLQAVSGVPELKPDESVVMISASVVCPVSAAPKLKIDKSVIALAEHCKSLSTVELGVVRKGHG